MDPPRIDGQEWRFIIQGSGKREFQTWVGRYARRPSYHFDPNPAEGVDLNVDEVRQRFKTLGWDGMGCLLQLEPAAVVVAVAVFLLGERKQFDVGKERREELEAKQGIYQGRDTTKEVGNKNIKKDSVGGKRGSKGEETKRIWALSAM